MEGNKAKHPWKTRRRRREQRSTLVFQQISERSRKVKRSPGGLSPGLGIGRERLVSSWQRRRIKPPATPITNAGNLGIRRKIDLKFATTATMESGGDI